MENSKYTSPEVNNPIITQHLVVDLTIFTERSSQKDFQKFMAMILEGTNWILMKNSIVDKL